MNATSTHKSLEERTQVLTKGYIAKPSLLKTAGIQYQVLEGLYDAQDRSYAIPKERLSDGFKNSSKSVDYQRPFIEFKYKDKTHKLVATNSDIKKAYDKARCIASVVDGKVLHLEGIYQSQIRRVLEDKLREEKSLIIEKIKEIDNPAKSNEIKDRNGVVYGTIDNKIQLRAQGKTYTYELTNEDKLALKNRIMIGEQFEWLDQKGKYSVVKKVLDEFIEERYSKLKNEAGISEAKSEKKPNTGINISLQSAKKRIEQFKNQPTLTQKVTSGFKKLKFW